ncbi:MAG: alanine--glyoxylate aminotransferase family protein [Desulfarculus sp.]|nr:alanine--glyoxylate aminotransferase family protein [Pseudomonadota bacterium]MBU4598684.1 alanine--glyoxylate aminotransferase family protein [Pseudomonadota bacterium]MBV1718190.1 alanine--glyoxylate aminotransferase family protein [Desulfarculus sp.]MBV1737748.1 alanine--glyoxylate aminotransferase family protein [Desulfarculus sp.]MBV1752948.1 alanine--glyoxylate aminotransferase family protein [Desulfarculus sp.]
MKKVSLLAPGPTPVPPRTLLAMAQPLIHHRSSDFLEIFGRVREGLKKIFKTNNEVLVFCSSGTGAMESSVANLLSPGDKAIAIRGGKFGERWTEILEAYGCQAVNLDVEWGYAVKPEDVAALLKADPSIKAVYVQALETSTGVAHPIKELAQVTKGTGAVLVVDAVSALGVYDIPTDEWGLDVVISGSQKAMMLPPGLAFASIGPKALDMMKTSKCPKFYFSWAKELKNQGINKGTFTSPVTLFMGLLDIFELIDEMGLDNIYKETEIKSKAFKAAMAALGLELYSKENASTGLSAVEAPAGIDAQDVVGWLKNKYAIFIAGGQAQAKGKIFRVAHMGYISEFDTLQAISAIEMALAGLGYKFEMGSGVAAAQKIFGEA